MSPVRGPESLSLSALELQDAATIAFAAELHAVRWGAGMCVAARVARRIQYECARKPIVAWLSRMASECQCARRACTHISLAVEKMALQVSQQQQMISTLVGQIDHTHIEALHTEGEEQEKLHTEGEGDATVMKDKLLAAETRNADLEKEIKSSKAVCTLGMLFAHLVFFQVELVEWSSSQWAFNWKRAKKSGWQAKDLSKYHDDE